MKFALALGTWTFLMVLTVSISRWYAVPCFALLIGVVYLTMPRVETIDQDERKERANKALQRTHVRIIKQQEVVE